MPVATFVKKDEKTLEMSCQYVKGVGPKRALLFKKIGLETVADLLYFPPRRYEDRRTLVPIGKLKVGEFQTTQGRVVASGIKETRQRFRLFQLAIEDRSGVLFATWFNQPYLKDRFKVGDHVILSGKVQWYGRDLQMMSPDYEILIGDETDLLHTGRIVPVYPLTEGMYQRSVRAILKNTLDQYLNDLPEFLPSEILEKHELINLKDAIHALHFPEDLEVLKKARYRLSFEEFLILQLGLKIGQKKEVSLCRERAYHDLPHLTGEFTRFLPFTLTGAQGRVLTEIASDLEKNQPMNRLLQGDVGSGKTLVACAALYLAIQNGSQGVLMVPTEVLAEQHTATLEKVFTPHQIRVESLVGDVKAREKKEIFAALADGRIQMLVGTHALLEEKVAFHRLGMVVIDEQHKFGVMQRLVLRQKGFRPDVLVMTATPIPRTLALTVYGDLDVSVLDEMPPGRHKVETYWIRKNKLNDAYHFIQQQIQKGGQAFIIYPLVEESEKKAFKAAAQMFRHLSQDIFKGFRLGLIHGRMRAFEKNKVLYQFRDQELDVLVSTTVIEVGVDIPNANVMLIENAEAFGLAQLHQLRGRVGRGSRKSYCVLEGDPKTEEGVKRLQTMVDTQDGFKIAEADLSIRGPGEFLGTRQHGLPEIRFGNLLTDVDIIQQARQEAQILLEKDPVLKSFQHQGLREKVEKRFLEKSLFLKAG
ncbi:MAG: ATP-dependent DNA helicase RecG [Chlamydiae bacterium]|nr:ATP-dependent DNA helicase RecG [Chlamydiota bacterium]MBI3266735.1 ATP-dependent DNA helicase RecG [Chlamydiota bacterium]